MTGGAWLLAILLGAVALGLATVFCTRVAYETVRSLQARDARRAARAAAKGEGAAK